MSGLPRILSSSATLTAGQIVTLNTTDLRNPFRSGMWIHAIRHQITPNMETGFARAGFIEAQFWMGRHFFSEKYVPIPLLDRMWNAQGDAAEVISGGPLSISIGFHYTWKLPKPLYVPENDVLVAKYYNPAATTTGVITSYVCQSAEGPPPDEINLPFLSTWTAPGGVGGAAKFIDVSSDSDLCNPYPQDAFLKRINGRVSISYGSDAQHSRPGIPDLAVKAWAMSSNGQAIVRDPAYWGHLFKMTERSWLTNALVKSGENFIFNVEQDYSAYGAFASSTFRPQIALMGYRKVRL